MFLVLPRLGLVEIFFVLGLGLVEIFLVSVQTKRFVFGEGTL